MSNRLFRSERHRNLALVSPPDTIPAYRISFPHCDGGPCDQGRRACPCPIECQTGAAEEAPETPGPKPSRRWALALGVLVVMLLAALMFGRPHQ